jgi:hypothetical protein
MIQEVYPLCSFNVKLSDVKRAMDFEWYTSSTNIHCSGDMYSTWVSELTSWVKMRIRIKALIIKYLKFSCAFSSGFQETEENV